VHGPQIGSFNRRKIRLASLKVALDDPAFDLREALARLDAFTSRDQHFGDGSGRGGAERQDFATFDASDRAIGRLAHAEAARA
jgi:hypothetical protein